MSRPTVVVTQWIHPEATAELATFCQPVLNPDREPLAPEALRERCREAEGLMVFMPDCIDDAFLAHCPRLRVVAAALKGYDNLDTDAMARRGIAFRYQEDLLSRPTAELALALILGLGRNLLPGDAHVRSGQFQGWRPTFYGTGLQGRRVGLLGLGALGRALARLLKPFDCDVAYVDTQRLEAPLEAELGVTWRDRPTLLETSDILLPLLPLTPSTLHLLDRSSLQVLKPGCLLVNVSRGSVVDEEAVVEALRSGPLGGYAADVFAFEDWARPDRPQGIPPALLAHPRTLFTPHLGSADQRVRLQIELRAVQQLRAFFEARQ